MSDHWKKPDFNPTPWAAGPHVQSVLASTQPRRFLVQRAAKDFRAAGQNLLIDCGKGVSLLGHFNAVTGSPVGKPSDQNRRRLAVIIHGWEGSSDSLYNLTVVPLLNRQGFDTLRLNLRDHGDSHHLNEALFHSCRLEEVLGAFKWINQEFPNHDVSIVGFSLGGNFALRVANRARAESIRLDRVVAICPVLDPRETMQALDQGWFIYEQHFIRKWRHSLLKKRAAFPQLYRFENLSTFKNLMHMTDYFVEHHTEYDNLHSYLNGYAITEGRLDNINVRTTVLLADDDPVIPVAGLRNMQWPEAVDLFRSPTGGHCGFLQGMRLRTWLDKFVLEQLTG